MASYLLIESRSDLESPDVAALREYAARLSRDGHRVDYFLVQNAVVGAQPGLAALGAAGVAVHVDGQALSARAVPVPAGGTRADIAELVSLLMTPGVIAVWH
ncbi:hypothetical protein KGA66_04770 [Actinocrinis puniceicyclus]|uniref:DsrE/DsrF-like family protein n=1 Tax=Actinocrinis puniceicyclus TaxID=977794 RepID=A0A8J8BAS5_9ACTN|nr:hypothetical protein [Actinocrinis puniceicyclus]MBS2962348.1 hypothetical protein [Actinocrinis puniceicyclus]